MASFLDMEPPQRRMYVARLMNMSPNDPADWPTEAVDRIIELAEKAADSAARDAVIQWSKGRLR